MFRMGMYLYLTLPHPNNPHYHMSKTQEIPLYISELLMALQIIYMLFSSSISGKQEEQEEVVSDANPQENPVKK